MLTALQRGNSGELSAATVAAGALAAAAGAAAALAGGLDSAYVSMLSELLKVGEINRVLGLKATCEHACFALNDKKKGGSPWLSFVCLESMTVQSIYERLAKR